MTVQIPFPVPSHGFALNSKLRVNLDFLVDQINQGAIAIAGTANTALSNLAAVAINTTLVSDTDNTDDLGTSSINWKSLYLGTSLILQETGAGTDTITLQAPSSIAAAYTLTLPTTDGDANQHLITNGSGVLSWNDPAGTIHREDYVVGTASGNYSGSTTVFDLLNTFTTGNSSLVVFVDGVLQTIGATIDYVETDSNTVTFNNALLVPQKVSFYYSIPTVTTDYATISLNNLGSVAINTTLVSDTTNTDDLGSLSIRWRTAYIGTTLNILSSTANLALFSGDQATTEVSIDNTAADGDPFLSWKLGGTKQFSMGVNDGESDVLQIGTTAIDTATLWQATAAGEITQPLQPSFLVTDGTGATDVTGDATVYTELWPTEIYDQGGDFASNTFTAPITGRYFLHASVRAANILISHTSRVLNIVTSNRSYSFSSNYLLAETDKGLLASVLADMDVNDTATVTIVVSGSTKTVDITASAVSNNFSGSLIN